jgi:CheY-like chemotaxis protein
VLVLTLVTERSAVAGFAVADVLSKPIRSDEVLSALGRAGVLVRERPTVLVIDDERRALELMSATLQTLGIVPVCAEGAAAAWECLRTLRPDAIVLDLIMPEKDGFALLDELRQREGLDATPIFVWTSMALSRAEIERLSQSAQAIIEKGRGGLEALVSALDRWRVGRVRPAQEA